MTRVLMVTNPQAVKVFYPKSNVYWEPLKDMETENAPGTDSFPAEFCKTFGTNKHLVWWKERKAGTFFKCLVVLAVEH